MIITIVTGTPGTGKTTFAKKYAKTHNAMYIDVNSIISEQKLSEGYDEEKQCEIIDTEKLNAALIIRIEQANKNKEDLVIDSHMSHNLPKEYVSKCFVTKCELKELEKRLQERKYSPKKVRENLDSEIMEICLTEAEEQGYDIEVVDTSSTQ